MLFGAHVSIAGGIFNAPLNAAKEHMECFQMFSRSPRGGKATPITEEIVTHYQENCSKHNLQRSYIHTPYYINFASSNNRVRHGSVEVIRDELERASQLGVTAVMTHLGSAKDVGMAKALDMTISGLQKALKGYAGSAQFLIENAAGAGQVIGGSFVDLGKIITALKGHDVGVCFDTCHAFASGYDLRTKAAVDATLKDFDKHIGLKKLVLVHANDSKGDLESHLDRHEHIGKGKIGMAGWKALVGHPKLQQVDFLLETPPGTARDNDLATLKGLRKK